MSNETVSSAPKSLSIHIEQKKYELIEIVVAVRDEFNQIVLGADDEISIIFFGPQFHRIYNIQAVGGIVVLEANCNKVGNYAITAKSKNLITAKSAFKIKKQNHAENMIKSLVANVNEEFPYDPTFYFTPLINDLTVGQSFEFQLNLVTNVFDFSRADDSSLIPAHSIVHSATITIVPPNNEPTYTRCDSAGVFNATSEHTIDYFKFTVNLLLPGTYFLIAKTIYGNNAGVFNRF